MTKHTPGPWHFIPENSGYMPDAGYGILHGSPGAGGWEKNLYVSVGCSGNAERALGEGVPEANARLISAAPDLLEALEKAREKIEIHMDSIVGEYRGGMEISALLKLIDAAIAKARMP